MADKQKTGLDFARDFTASLVAATPEQLDALALTCAVTHCIELFTTVPRLLATSAQGGSGKSTVLHAAKMLAYNGWWATNATEPAVKSAFLGNEGKANQVTLLVDEISKIFGEAGVGGKTNKIYTILVQGYESTATYSFSSGHSTQDIPIYGVAFMAGLKTAVPPDLRSRSIEIRMKEASARALAGLEDALDPDTRHIGMITGLALRSWVRHPERLERIQDYAKNGLRCIHPKLTGRRRQVWGPLFTIAAAAGGDWPRRCLRAFTTLALDTSDRPALALPQQILLDASDYARDHAAPDGTVFSRDMLRYFKELDREVYAPLSDRAFAKLMSEALGDPRPIRGTFVYDPDDGPGEPHKGRYASDFEHEAEALRSELSLSCGITTRDEWDAAFD